MISFTIEQKESFFIFTNRGTVDLVIEQIPLPPKRKRWEIFFVEAGKFLVIPLKENEIFDLSQISIREK